MENIKYGILLLALAGIFVAGCSGSAESIDDDYVTDTQTGDASTTSDTVTASEEQSLPQTVSPQQRFNVQADTVTVQSRKKEKAPSSPIAVKSAAIPQKYYSVQIGAFRLKSNAERNYRLSLKRFKQPVTMFFEKGIKMDRICVGHFSTMKEAVIFLRGIQKQFPHDYNDAWIAGLKK